MCMCMQVCYIMKLLVTCPAYWYLVRTHIWIYTLNKFLHMLNCRMMIAVFLFLSVFDKWKSSNFNVVILCGDENHVCAHVSCAVACDSLFYCGNLNKTEYLRLKSTFKFEIFILSLGFSHLGWTPPPTMPFSQGTLWQCMRDWTYTFTSSEPWYWMVVSSQPQPSHLTSKEKAPIPIEEETG